MDWNKRKPSTLRVDLDDQEPSTSRPSTSSERKPSTSSEPHPSTLYEPQPSTSSGITSTCSAHCCRRGGNSSWTIYNNTPCTICAAWLKKRMRRIENQRASTSLESQSTSDAGQNNGGHHAHHRHDSRPELSAIKKNIHRISTNREISAQLEVVLRQVEDYADSLEERTADYLEEMRRCEDLLYRVLPRTVASQLMTGEYEVIAEAYDEVTIYFSDIIGFTEISAVCTAMQVVKLLNDLYSLFDSIIEKFDVYKVETIGDAYMAVSGLPTRNGNHHAYEIARMALALRDAATTEYLPYDPTQPITLRIGMHTGPCVAGIVGMHMPRYCLFGDTVNTASRMETYSMEQRIHLSARTKALLDPYDEFIFESRGKVYVKGKGLMNTYWLVGMKDTNHPIIKPPYMPMKIISINKLAKIPEIYNNNGNDDIIEERLKVRPIIKTKTVSHDYNHQRNIAKKEYKTENLLFTKKSLKITRFQNKSEIISEYEDEAEDEAEDKAENNDKDIAENKTGIVDENKAEVLDEDETEQCDTFSPSYDRSFTISKGKVRRVIEKFENGT